MYDDETIRRDAEKVAHGGQPQWEHTARHRLYGELTFTGRMPDATGLTAQSLRVDELLNELPADVTPRTATMVLVAARAGLPTLIDLPVIREENLVDDPETGHTKVKQHFYNPDTEIDERFLANVWLDYSQWRDGILQALDSVKSSSGGTSGSESAGSSTAAMEPPQATPDSTAGPTPTTSESSPS